MTASDPIDEAMRPLKSISEKRFLVEFDLEMMDLEMFGSRAGLSHCWNSVSYQNYDDDSGVRYVIGSQFAPKCLGKSRMDFLLYKTNGASSVAFVVELDGKDHRSDMNMRWDRRKERTILQEFNLHTVRLFNNEIDENPGPYIRFLIATLDRQLASLLMVASGEKDGS